MKLEVHTNTKMMSSISDALSEVMHLHFVLALKKGRLIQIVNIVTDLLFFGIMLESFKRNNIKNSSVCNDM